MNTNKSAYNNDVIYKEYDVIVDEMDYVPMPIRKNDVAEKYSNDSVYDNIKRAAPINFNIDVGNLKADNVVGICSDFDMSLENNDIESLLRDGQACKYSNRNKTSNKCSNWSATATMNMAVQDGKMTDETYQTFVDELVRDKCWNKKDADEFSKLMEEVDYMIKNTTEDNMTDMLLNPNYYNKINKIFDKLDTINVMCALSVGDKCDNIKKPENKKIIHQQIDMIGELVDIYTPIFIRSFLLLDKFINETSKTCKLDQQYIDAMDELRKRFEGSIYYRKMAKADYNNNNNNNNSQDLKNMSNQNDVSSDNSGTSSDSTGNNYNWFVIFLLIVLIVVAFAQFFDKNKESR